MINEPAYAVYFDEIIDFAQATENYSYYDLYGHAYSEKNEWLPVFQDRNMRYALSEYLKSARRKAKGKNKITMSEAMERYLAAKAEYRKRISAVDTQSEEQEVEE